jgi:hypothetical protein
MACSPTKGRLLPCKDAVGGISGIYFVDYGTITPSYDVTQTNVLDDLGAITAYKYDIKSASNLIQTMTSSKDNGTTFVNQVITAILQKMTWSDNAEILLLGYGRPHVVVHYNTGEAVTVGLEFGASLETGVADSGTAMGDLNGYTLTVSADERKYANYLKGATVSNPFAGLTTAPTVVVGTETPAP